MKYSLRFLTLLFAAAPAAWSQDYTVGDIVEDVSLIDFRTGQPVSLYELGAGGGILVLEWFAWWCPFCASAAANVETGIVGHYAARGGNPQGLPVRHIGLNVQANARTQTTNFINRYNFGTVLEDTSRSFFSRFSPGGGQPLFVIVNAEAGSPTAQRWEVLYTRLNYSGNAANDISALMRPVIDGVQAGSAPDPLETYFTQLSGPVDGWYESGWFGWFYGASYPLIQHLELGYGYLAPAGASDSLFLYDLELGWVFTGKPFYPHLYSLTRANWLFYLAGTDGEWFYDYASMDWRRAGQLGNQPAVRDGGAAPRS